MSVSEGQPALTPVEESTIRTLAESNCHIRPASVLKVLDALARERKAKDTLEAVYVAGRKVLLAEVGDRTGIVYEAQAVVDLKREAEGRVRDLQEALRFYADERNYKEQPTPDAERGHYPTHKPVATDGGGRARKALVGLPEAK